MTNPAGFLFVVGRRPPEVVAAMKALNHSYESCEPVDAEGIGDGQHVLCPLRATAGKWIGAAVTGAVDAHCSNAEASKHVVGEHQVLFSPRPRGAVKVDDSLPVLWAPG